MPLPKFIKIDDKYHNVNLLRNITEQINSKEGKRCITVEIHGEMAGKYFLIQTICDKNISNSLKTLMNVIKEREKNECN